MINSLNSSCIP